MCAPPGYYLWRNRHYDMAGAYRLAAAGPDAPIEGEWQ